MTGLPEFHLPPPEPRGRSAWPKEAQAAMGCGTGCLTLILLEALLLWGGVHLFLNLSSTVRVILDAPEHAQVGRAFPIRLTVKNGSAVPILIEEVRIPRQVLESMEFGKINPAPVTGPLTVGGKSVYTFKHEIKPGGAWILTMNAWVKREGAATGEIELTGALPRTLQFKIEGRKAAAAPAASQAAPGPAGAG